MIRIQDYVHIVDSVVKLVSSGRRFFNKHVDNLLFILGRRKLYKDKPVGKAVIESKIRIPNNFYVA